MGKLLVTDYSNSIGNGLRKYRKAKGLSQSQLADQLGITQPSLSRIERGDSIPGKENYDSIVSIANAGNSTLREDVGPYFKTAFCSWVFEVLTSDIEYRNMVTMIRDAAEAELRKTETKKEF